jgi:hypothetical protein
MKKNKMMCIATGVLVLTLLTAGIISGTFAKYVTTAGASDTARVAKWGMVITTSGTLFGSDEVNIVAPGTKSADTGFTFGITGAPEVSSIVSAAIEAKDIYLAEGTYGVMEKVTVDAKNFASKVNDGLYTFAGSTYTKVGVNDTYNSSNTYYALAYTATVGSDGYYPVKYSWYPNGAATADADATSASAIAKAIAGKFTALADDTDPSAAGVKYAVEKTVAPNIDLTDATNGIGISGDKITWEWTYYDSNDKDKDKRDSILGNLMARNASDTTAPVVVMVAATATTNDTITVLSVDADTGIVSYTTNEGTKEVGSIRTSFDITLTATQVD